MTFTSTSNRLRQQDVVLERRAEAVVRLPGPRTPQKDRYAASPYAAIETDSPRETIRLPIARRLQAARGPCRRPHDIRHRSARGTSRRHPAFRKFSDCSPGCLARASPPPDEMGRSEQGAGLDFLRQRFATHGRTKTPLQGDRRTSMV
jgi:hypothetical protein